MKDKEENRDKVRKTEKENSKFEIKLERDKVREREKVN